MKNGIGILECAKCKISFFNTRVCVLGIIVPSLTRPSSKRAVERKAVLISTNIHIIIMSGKKKKCKKTKAASAAAGASTSQKTHSDDDGPASIGAAKENGSTDAAVATARDGGDVIIRDLPPPSQTVQPRGAAAMVTPPGASAAAGANSIPGGGGEEAIAVGGKKPTPSSHFSLGQPIPMTHSYSLPSLPSTSLRPRMSSIVIDGGGAFNDPASTSLISRDLSSNDLQQPPGAPVPILSRTLSTPESSSNLRSAFGRAGSAFGRFSTAAASRPNTTYTQSDPGFSAFHPVAWNCQRSLSSAGSGSLVGSEIIEEHDGGSGLRTSSARTSSAPSNNMTRGFLLKAREKLQTNKTKRRSGRENPARPSLSDTEDASSPPTTIVTNDDAVEISIAAEDKNKNVPPKIERVASPSKISAALRKKREASGKSKSATNEGHHEDPGLELNFSDDSDDEGSIDEVVHQPGVEVALKPSQSNRPPSRASNTSQVPFDEKVQSYSHVATTTKTSAAGAVAANLFKFKSPQRRSKTVTSPSSHTTSSSPHQSPNAGTASSSSNGSPNSRGGLSTISSNSNSISSTGNMRNKINSAASSPGGGDSCARESMGSSTTNAEIRDIVKQAQEKSKRQPRSAIKAEGNVEDGYDTVSVDMDGNATVHSSSAGSCNSTCLREGAINPMNPHIVLTDIPGRAPSVSPNRFSEAAHEAPFDEQSSGSPEVGGNTDSTVLKKEGGISKFISFNSKKVVRSQSPHSTDAHTTSSASASVSNATSSSSGTGGDSQQPVKFVAFSEEREESPFDEHHDEENRNSTPQNLVRPTITNGGSSVTGQRPPTSPRKLMSGRISLTPPPTQLLRDAPPSVFNTPCSPPTIADGPNVLVGDLAGKVDNMKIRNTHRPISKRLNILVAPKPPKIRAAPIVIISPEKNDSQATDNIEDLHQQDETKGKHDKLNSAIVSPEKAT